MEGAIKDAGLYLGAETGLHGDAAAGREKAHLISIDDTLRGGIIRMDSERVLHDDIHIAGAPGHGAAVIVLQQATCR